LQIRVKLSKIIKTGGYQTAMPIITVEKPLKDKLGDEGVDSLIRLLNQSQQNQKQDLMVYLEEKYEHRLGEEVGAISVTIAETEKRLDNRITEEIGKVNERITKEIADVKVEISNVRSDASKNHANLIKWMFIFWMGQVIALVGILSAFFK
jgi:gas vesicle protein